MKKMSLLRIGGWLNMVLAVGHLLCMPWLYAAFRMYGIESIMEQIASYGSYWPYVITVIIAFCFALAGLYAFSAEGDICRLPLLWIGIFTVAFIFLSRALMGCCSMLVQGQFRMNAFSSVVIAGGIGLLYLIGGIRKLRKKN